MYFLRKIFFYFPSKEKISYFREKRNTIFPDITKKIIFEWQFLERPSFQKMWRKKIWFFVEWCFCSPELLLLNLTYSVLSSLFTNVNTIVVRPFTNQSLILILVFNITSASSLILNWLERFPVSISFLAIIAQIQNLDNSTLLPQVF